MRVRRIGVALAAGALVATGLSACGSPQYDSAMQKAEEEGQLTIGVKYDQPGLGLKNPQGEVEGFDVDVAKYIADKLGVPEDGITFKEARSANRESFLKQGQVDMILATYSILPERQEQVDFAGPYIVAHQDTLVRGDDDSIDTVEDLEGKGICQVSGSNSWKRVTEDQGVDAELVPASAYDECITKLKGNTLDAVSTDDAILAGYAAREGDAVKFINDPFTDEKYGVGLKEGDTRTCEAVNGAITDMYEDGTAKQLLDKHFGPADLKVSYEVPQFEGCGTS